MIEADTPTRAAFEAWAAEPCRAAKLPLERWPLNNGYRDERTYSVWYGWKFASLHADKDRAQRQDAETWSLYIASMVEAYLQSQPATDKREAAIAGIISRRLWALPDRAQRQAVQAPAFYANDDLACDFATGGQGGMWVHTAKGGTHNTPLYTAAPPPAQVPEGCGEVPYAPDHCPITGRKFWGNIEHPTMGLIATYGGPFDTFTIPARSGEGELRSERYCQDRGEWMDSEPVGWFYEDQQ